MQTAKGILDLTVKFSLNQIGLAIDYKDKDGEWRGIDLIEHKHLPDGQPCNAQQFIDTWLESSRNMGYNITVDSIYLG